MLQKGEAEGRNLIICVGPPRSGTMTFHRAFLEAGINSCHQRVSGEMPPISLQVCRAYVEDRNPLYYIPRGVGAITDAHLTRDKQYDNASYWPFFMPGLLKSVREYNDDVWIILNTRDPKAWVASLRRWKNLHGRIQKADLPFLPPGDGSNDEDMIKWINGHNKRVRDLFRDDPQFLEIDIKDKRATQKLEKAFDREFPWWGIMNANPEITPDEN